MAALGLRHTAAPSSLSGSLMRHSSAAASGWHRRLATHTSDSQGNHLWHPNDAQKVVAVGIARASTYALSLTQTHRYGWYGNGNGYRYGYGMYVYNIYMCVCVYIYI